MTIVSVRTGAVLLSWICLLFSLQARSDDQRQAVTALAPERPLILPAMKAGAFSAGRAILISGRGVETVSQGSIPRQSAPKPQADIGMCLDPLDPRLLR